MLKTIKSLTGNEAAAWSARLARVKLAYSFPMGPNAEVTETLQQFVDEDPTRGPKIIYADNEKSAMSMQIGSARLGIRTMFCTTSEGMLWAMADGHYGAGSRLPMLIACPSRALEPPTTVFCDHDDFLVWRDMGWLMFYCEDAQDVLYTMIQAYRVAEDPRVMLPVLVGYDGWETSHASVPVTLPTPEEVDAFLPPADFIKPEKDYLNVDWKKKFSRRRLDKGLSAMEFMEIKHHQRGAMEKAAEIIDSVGARFGELFETRHAGLIESHACEDAEIIVVAMGIVYPAVRFVVDAFRERGIKVGCLKLRVFRPFPAEAVCRVVQNARLVISIDRNSLEAIYWELAGAFYTRLAFSQHAPWLMGWVIGIGGWAVRLEHLGHIIKEGLATLQGGKLKNAPQWYPLRPFHFDPQRDHFSE